MTNSFRPQAAPVDTFVRPVSVAPPTDLDVLARALKTVNPGIEAFLDHKMDEAIEDEQQKGIEIAYDELLDDGSVKKAVDKVRKKDGNEAARQLIGGSIFSQKAYERMRTKILASKFQNTFDADYLNAKIDTGEVDAEGQPILYALRELPHNSEHVQAWRQERANNYLSQLEGISPKIVNDNFMPTMRDNFLKFTSKHSKDHREFQFEKLQLQIPNIVSEASDYVFKGNLQDAKTKINDHLDLLRNAGITGPESKKVYKDIIDNIIAISNTTTTSNNRTLLKKAYSLPTTLAGMISYGPRGSKTLLDHPDFAEKNAKFINDFYGKKKRAIEDKKAVEILLRDKELEDLQTAIANEKDPVKANQMFTEYLNNPENSNIREEVNKIGILDDYIIDTEIIPEIEAGIITGKYQSPADAITDINIYRSKHPTMNDEAVEKFNNLVKTAKAAKGIGSKVEDVVQNIMDPVKENLGKTTLGGFRDDKNRRKAVRLERQTNISIQKWALDFIKVNERSPNDYEWNQIERQYQDQLFGEIGILDPDDVEKTYPTKEFNNPFKGITGKKIQKKIEPPAIDPDKPSSTKTKPEESFMAPDPSNMGDQSSNPVIDTVNQVVNALTGTGTAAAGTLDGRSVLEEIDITQPIAQPNLQRLAIEGGFTPEQARIMAAIAMAESGGVARALNDVGDDNSFGLWQINMIDVPDYKLGEERRAKLNLKTNDELYNPATNVRAAKMIFDEQGFEAWGAYTNEDYKDFLPQTN